MSTNASRAFDEVRPYCVEFIQSQSIESVKKLHSKLLDINKDALDEISPYILFPFRVVLKKHDKKKEDLLVEVCHCLEYVFKCSTINDWLVIHEFLTSLCGVLTDPADKSFTACGSEELKKAIAGVIGGILGHACYPLWQSLYHHRMIPMLGHMVTLLLSVVKSSVVRDARIASCKALKSLCHPEYCELLEESQQVLAMSAIGDCMACFLPGISSCLAKVISGDMTGGQRVKSACLDLLAAVITATLGCKTLSSAGGKSEKPVSLDQDDEKLASLLVTRDEKWVSAVAEKLGPVIVNAASASDSDSWALRLSCVEFCGQILLECGSTLKSCSNALLKVPVKLLNDDYPQIAEKCTRILDEFSSKLEEEESGSQILVEILEENLFVLSTDLPRLMRRDPDKNKLSTLKILLGYLTLLREKINNLLYSTPHLKKLSTALLQCLELDATHVHVLEQVTPFEGTVDALRGAASMSSWCFRKHFAHFRDANIYENLKSICRVLGRYGDLELLTDHFLEVYSTSESNCRQAIIILSEVLIGAETAVKNLQASVKSVMDEILTPENWYLVTSYDSDYVGTFHQNRVNKSVILSLVPASASLMRGEDLTLKSLKSNVILCCLQLEAIFTFSKVLRVDFRVFLMEALYPLLEKTTDSDTTISECALDVVRGVAFNCGYKSPREMIADNADYLISTISIQLHHLEMFPRCPAVLQAMLDHSNVDMLVIVSDTVDEILTALDLHHLNPSKLLVFLPVLFSVVRAVKRWTSDHVTTELPNEKVAHNVTKEEMFLSSADGPLNQDTAVTNDILLPSNPVQIVKNSKAVAGLLLSESQPANDVTKENIVTSSAADDDVTKAKKFAADLKNSLLEIQRNQKIAALELEAEVDPDWEPEKEEDVPQEDLDVPEEKEQVPLEIKVTSKVLSRCVHLMSHADPRVRMRVMDIVANGMDVLKAKENELLPMAHKIWSPMVARFADKELQVVARAFDTLSVMASYCRDFLRKRFCKEILPKILSVLELQAKHSARLSKRPTVGRVTIRMPNLNESRNRTSDSIAYMHSTAYKLQRKALLGLGPILKSLDISRKDHIAVCKSCISYLSTRQPQQLQDAGMVLFRDLIDVDCDLTWLRLSAVWCPDPVLHPPEGVKSHPMGLNFKTVYLGGSCDRNNEFAKNIKILLAICQKQLDF